MAKSKNKKQHQHFEYEFGGPIVVTFIILWSHFILYYFWYTLTFHSGSLYLPISSFNEFISFPYELYSKITTNALPTYYTTTCYSLFFIFQLITAQFMLGFTIYGFPVKNRKNKSLSYLINGYYCYYILLIILLILHILNIFPLQTIVNNLGSWLSTGILLGDLTSLYWYIFGFITNQTEKMSGNHIYDFFMGSLMYPRIGKVDIKMVAEIRWSWTGLFVITLSSAAAQYAKYETITPQMGFMIIAHWLYSNATHKGEHYVVYCWDMYAEKYGWMLNFWNVTGVPFMYAFQSLYISLNSELYVNNSFNWIYIIFCYVLLFGSYYIWDCSNAQKTSFKRPELKKYDTRFPVVPYSFLKNPKIIETPKGKLLIDGCWKYARKMNYSGDILMALSWGLITGFSSWCNYFYVVFFTGFILHRQYARDELHCQEKYGKYWKQYKKEVPYLLIPYVF